MKIIVVVSRILLGLGFLIFGLNILFPFMPQPPLAEGSMAAQFMGVAGPSHWMSVVGLFQTIGGALVLLGGTAPLGLVLLAPILFNIVFFHLGLMQGEGIGPGLVLSALEIFLIYAYRNHFSGLLTTKARPNTSMT